MSNVPLLIHAFVCSLCIIVNIGMGLFVLKKGEKTLATRVFFALNMSVAFFYITHLLGVFADSKEMAFVFFSANWSNILTSLFGAHFVMIVIGADKRHRFFVWLMYITAFALIFLFIAQPHLLLNTPVSKLYLPYYYVPGPLYTLMRVYIIIFPIYVFILMLGAYARAQAIERTRYLWVIFGMVCGYLLGNTAVLLIYDIPVNPTWSLFFGLYPLFLAYAILKYDFLNISILAKRAVWYAGWVIFGTLLLLALNEATRETSTIIPWLPAWLIPFAISCGAVILGAFVWTRFKQIDVLKYEFITVVTHKFRTPLTAINWSTDILMNPGSAPEDRAQALVHIKGAQSRLVNLIEVLSEATQEDSTHYEYHFSDQSLEEILQQARAHVDELAIERRISFNYIPHAELPKVSADPERIRFILQSLLENAVNYSKENGHVDISFTVSGRFLSVSVRDYGIGISREELEHIFTRFYRTEGAISADTEGLGMGLSIAKKIAVRHGGDLKLQSDGVGTGTTATLTLPWKK